MDNNELYLKTAFCCMACDGNIAEEEIALLKSFAANEHVFDGLDIQDKINEYVAAINEQGNLFLNQFINEVKEADLEDDAALQLIKIAIEIIEADKLIEYSEVSFFKRIRKQLKISDDVVLAALPDKEDFFLPDIEEDHSVDWDSLFGNIQFEDIRLGDISTEKPE